jgi:hypothetical protein
MIMKRKILILAGAVLLLTAVGCSKKKTCRCIVRGANSSLVRVVKINKGECTSLQNYEAHDELDSIWNEPLLCTDYEFRIDTIFEEK